MKFGIVFLKKTGDGRTEDGRRKTEPGTGSILVENSNDDVPEPGTGSIIIYLALN